MPQETTLDDFRALTKRAGLDLTDDELEHLKPMYDHYLEPHSPHERARPRRRRPRRRLFAWLGPGGCSHDHRTPLPHHRRGKRIAGKRADFAR